MPAEICVVHLVWAPLGTGPLERFVASYRRHPAGVPHRLLVAYKGFADGDAIGVADESFAGVEHERVAVESVGFDLASYILLARAQQASDFCFLNSTSTILADEWLSKLHAPLMSPATGIAGATGSHESTLTSAPWPLRFRYRRHFDAFPNPHIRTNAFMISRSLMLDLDWAARSRTQALRLESGRDSITRQVLARGLQAVVVGRDGASYSPEQWPRSRTFRSGGQANLLIADNRTRQFSDADSDARRHLARHAWGADGAGSAI